MTTPDTGARTVIHIEPEAGEEINVLGELLTFKLESAMTGGAVSLAVITSPPGGGPPALHTHPPLEAFYVLEGEYEMNGMTDDGPFTVWATPGSVIYVPPGAPHNYKNVGSTPGRMLVVFTDPAAEAFQKDLAAASAGGPPDPATLMPVLQRHAVAFVGPLPDQR